MVWQQNKEQICIQIQFCQLLSSSGIPGDRNLAPHIPTLQIFLDSIGSHQGKMFQHMRHGDGAIYIQTRAQANYAGKADIVGSPASNFRTFGREL